MALCCDFGILKIFGFGDGKEVSSSIIARLLRLSNESQNLTNDAGEVLYACYLSMARAGIAALQFWDPASRKWGQPHMQARYAILQVFLSAGPEFCSLDYASKDDVSDLTIKLDRSKILSHGRPAVDKFLQKLHIFKACADVDAAKELYERMTHVDDFWATKVRAEVLKQAKPRKVFVQANTFLEDGKVVLKEYEATPQGMINSFADRDYI